MTANIPNRIQGGSAEHSDVVAVMPDFPFDHGKFVTEAGLAPLFKGADTTKRIAIIGAGISGLVAGYELLRAGFKPVIFEASDRIGGRMYSKPLENGGIAELGAMRFPPTCKTLFHYFEKVKMTAKSGDFPNPATVHSPGTHVNYRGIDQYYDVSNSEKFPTPPEYIALQKKWNSLLNTDPFNSEGMRKYLSDPDKYKKEIKDHWNKLLNLGYDNISFHRALVDAKWSAEEIELFGQVGFGSGGWNTNFVNCFLEVLRVAYTDMESNHKLFYDGVNTLPNRLFQGTPSSFGDEAADETKNDSLKTVAEEYFGKDKILHNVVRGIDCRLSHGIPFEFEIYLDGPSESRNPHTFDTVIYTPHVRVLQVMRDSSRHGKETRKLLTEDMWEAIEYTHYMQSSKTFVSAKSEFWKEKDADGRYLMSTTLSDRVTRGTYLLNYKYPIEDEKEKDKAVICLTYTWNDDALKMLPLTENERASIALLALDDFYPDLKINDHINIKSGGGFDSATIMWDQEKFFIGAFKNNLPGHYRYQRLLYSHFAESDLNRSGTFFLAGDDISWTGGWSEGAVTTGLNAAHAVVNAYGGKAHNEAGPLDKWEELKPIKLSSQVR